ncbi:hypothetical protein CsSME_00051980 [Camellia sinensis var. sinensis]
MEELVSKSIDEEIDNIDRWLSLPEDVIHGIMSFLPTKEIVRTCVLSHRWEWIQASYPNLDFNQTWFGEELIFGKFESDYLLQRYPDIEVKRDKFIKFVDDTLLRYHEQNFRIRKFKLYFTLVDSAMGSLVDRWIALVIKCRVEGLHIWIIPPDYALYTLPHTIFSANSIQALELQNGCKFEQASHRQSIRFVSLRKLCLRRMHVDMQLVENIISSCPLIEEIELDQCLGLKKVQISGLHNLKIVRVVQGKDGIELVDIEAPSLYRLSYETFATKISPCKFNLIACRNLKQFTLLEVVIADQQFNDLITEFPLLERLVVFDCNLLERVKIQNQCLKDLRFIHCNKLEEIEIDAPNLHSFHYCGNLIPSIASKSASGQWKADFRLYQNNRLNSQWFHRIRDFLTRTKYFKALTLVFCCFEITFNKEEFSNILVPSIPVLEHVELCVVSSSLCYSALLDELLWSCRPKTLSIHFAELVSPNKFIKVLREKFAHKFDLNCCDLSSVRCWQHDLNDFECYDGDGRPLPWNAISDEWTNVEKSRKMRITFTW